ncbi:MAG: Holliday junction branch migration protein RuvA [Lachnospiraceae bacterium]|nr:Holliday junction branch migration protein RuvA [Lachnospiraceae bacterium]
MIGFLQGKVDSFTENRLYLNVGGVGFEVIIPSGASSRLPAPGEDAKIYTYLSVKEDGMSLYGFPEKDDLDIFKLLITVSGIGPKGAQAILSVLTPDDLRFAILSGDAKAISKAPGVGKKSAERLILELKDKISVDRPFNSDSGDGTRTAAGGSDSNSSARDEAAEALIALGYSATDAYRAVKAADSGEEMDSNTLLREALKRMGG